MAGARRLIFVWAAMAALTLAGVPLGRAIDPRPLGAALTVAVLALAFVKASLLLNDYLGLKNAPGWNKGLRSSVLLLLAVIAALALAAR